MARGRKRRRRVPPGPIAPWRFSASVLSVALLLGRSLLNVGDTDLFERTVAYGAAFGAAVWFALGVIDRAISTAQASAPRLREGDGSPADGSSSWSGDRDPAQRR